MRTCKTMPLRSRRDRGFSLIEVVIGMTILAMITTTLFGIIKGSVKGASDIEKLQRENDQINRFLDQCRVTIDTMPASATLKLTMMDASSGLQEFNVSGNSTCFPFGPNPISYNDTTVGLRPDIAKPMTEGANPMPRYILGITRKDIIPQTSNTTVSVQQSGAGQDAADDQGRIWMPLLPGVVVRSRAVGILRMDDEAGGDAKILAVPTDKSCPFFRHWKSIKDVPEIRLHQIQHFFEHYKDLEEGKWVKVLGWSDVDAAHAEIMAGIDRFNTAKTKPVF